MSDEVRVRPSESVAEQIIAAAAAAHVILALAFIATLASASWSLAGEGSFCAGANLVEKWKTDAPEKLAKAEAQAAQAINGNSVFWRISSDGAPDSYLFGTMHSADPRIAQPPELVRKAFDASATIMIENIDALDPAKMAQAMVNLRRYTLLADGKTLDQMVSDDATPKLKAAVEARDMPWKVARHLQPWLVTATISIPVCDFEEQRSGKPVLDTMLGKMAQESGKQLVGLETIEEQFAAVQGVPAEFHLNALKETLALGAKSTDILETTKQLYLDGRIGMMLPLVRQLSPETYKGSGYTEFRENLLSRRNRVMADRASSHLREGSAFIAVGALHLPGEDGLVELLRGAGFTVTAEPVSPRS